MSHDAAATDVQRPITVTMGVAAGFTAAGLLVLRGVLVLVHPPVLIATTEREQHVFNVGLTIGQSVGVASSVVFSIVIGVAALLAFRGSHGWRVALAVVACWQAVGAVASLIETAVANIAKPPLFAHISQPSPTLLIATALAGALCGLLVLLPTSNRWYRALRPAPAAPAGWYPIEDGMLRWWDGATWTDHTHELPQDDQQGPGAHE